MTTFFSQVPIWVWPLFILLLVVGLRARRTRMAPVALIYCLPLLGIMALRSVAGLSGGGALWAVFAMAYVAGAAFGFRLQRGWTGDRHGRLVQLRGEGVTLLAMMTVFWANFLLGFVHDVAPQIVEGRGFQIGFAAVLAVVSGSFAGRALQIWHAGQGERAL